MYNVPIVVLEHKVVINELLVLLGGHGFQGVVCPLQLSLQRIQSINRNLLHLFALLSGNKEFTYEKKNLICIFYKYMYVCVVFGFFSSHFRFITLFANYTIFIYKTFILIKNLKAIPNFKSESGMV